MKYHIIAMINFKCDVYEHTYYIVHSICFAEILIAWINSVYNKINAKLKCIVIIDKLHPNLTIIRDFFILDKFSDCDCLESFNNKFRFLHSI